MQAGMRRALAVLGCAALLAAGGWVEHERKPPPNRNPNHAVRPHPHRRITGPGAVPPDPQSPPDTGSYKTDAALKARDPFQNVYSAIANDLVAARDALPAGERRDIRRVTQLAFAGDLAPAAMSGYLARDPKGLVRVARLPATDDPIATRVERIRQRDATVIDTVNGYYANFSDQMSLSYGQLRPASFEVIDKEQRAPNQARTRTYLGAAAVLASVLVPNQCSVYDYNCQRVQSAARYGGALGGTAGGLSGLEKYADAQGP